MVLFSRIDLDPEMLKKRRRRFLWLGVLMIIIGVMACVMPLAASFAIETVVGASLIVAGVGRLWLAFTEKSFMQILLMLCCVLSGVFFLTRPLAGMIAIGTFLGVFFAVAGVAKIFEYFRLRGLQGAFIAILSGIIDLFLAYSIWSNLFNAASTPGILMGVDLLFTGAAMISLSSGCSRMAKMMGASHRVPSDSSPDEY